MTEDSRSLRQRIRRTRRQLDAMAQQEAAFAVQTRLEGLDCFQQAQHIALFIAADGEVDLQAVLSTAEKQGKHCYLPAMDPMQPGLLCFRRYCQGDTLLSTPLGVVEPGPQAAICPLQQLDLVLTPLVAFDAQLNRMGMGKGFYDKTFAFRQQNATWSKPWLVGVAHECQRVEHLETAWWDVPLDAVVTPERSYFPSPPDRLEAEEAAAQR